MHGIRSVVVSTDEVVGVVVIVLVVSVTVDVVESMVGVVNVGGYVGLPAGSITVMVPNMNPGCTSQ